MPDLPAGRREAETEVEAGFGMEWVGQVWLRSVGGWILYVRTHARTLAESRQTGQGKGGESTW